MTYTASQMVDLYVQAEADILAHGQSSAFEGRSLTTADLGEIRRGRREWEVRAKLAAAQAGAPSFPHSLGSFSTR